LSIQNILSAKPELLEPTGTPPGMNSEQTFHLLYENQTSMQACISGNPKLTKIMTFIDELKVNAY